MDNNSNLQQVAEDYQPGDCLNEGTPIFILLSVQPRVRKKNEAPHMNKDRKLSAAGGTD